MDKTEVIARRAMEIYLNGKGTLKEAYRQAENEMLMGDIPKEIQGLFKLNKRR